MTWALLNAGRIVFRGARAGGLDTGSSLPFPGIVPRSQADCRLLRVIRETAANIHKSRSAHVSDPHAVRNGLVVRGHVWGPLRASLRTSLALGERRSDEKPKENERHLRVPHHENSSDLHKGRLPRDAWFLPLRRPVQFEREVRHGRNAAMGDQVIDAAERCGACERAWHPDGTEMAPKLERGWMRVPTSTIEHRRRAA
jgi:hypothetical protein